MLTSRSPSSKDLKGVQTALMSLPNAWGCVSPDGRFRPRVDLHSLWAMINVSGDEMAKLWRQGALSTDAKSLYSEMQKSSQHTVSLIFTKLKKSLFGSQWCGTVSLDFGRWHVNVGAVAGNTQAEVWGRFRAFLAGNGPLFADTERALESLTD